MRPLLRRGSLVALSVCALAAISGAHERKFTQSRDWFLPFKGEHEFEFRTFMDTTKGSKRAQIEYEYGITDHFAIEPGIEIGDDGEGQYEIEAADLELRFNFGTYEPDRWLTAFNLETEFPREEEEPERAEGKLIFARYGSDGNDYAINFNAGLELEDGGNTESEMTGGWLHAVDQALDATGGRADGLRYGAEFVADFDEEHGRLGPLLEYRFSRRWHLLGSYVVAVNDRDENSDVASIILELEI